MKIEKDINVKEFTTFRIGGNAQFFCTVSNEPELIEAVTFAKEHKLPIFVLGGGSNILVSDKGIRGLVIRMEIMGIEMASDTFGKIRVTAHAGENWDAFVGKVVEEGLYGLENLSYIPGTVGAAPVQNIGAYGSEVKDSVEIVRAYDLKDGEFKTFTNFDCQFEYRDSLFKREGGRYIITSVDFLLSKDGKVNTEYRDIRDYFAEQKNENPTLQDVRKAVIEIRKRKLPDVKEWGTAGSFFKNQILPIGVVDDLKAKHPGLPVYPVDHARAKISLAWIIDKVCGYKGVAKGDVGTYKNQALVLVNNGNATGEEILFFANEIKKLIKEKTGVDAEFEVQLVGF